MSAACSACQSLLAVGVALRTFRLVRCGTALIFAARKWFRSANSAFSKSLGCTLSFLSPRSSPLSKFGVASTLHHLWLSHDPHPHIAWLQSQFSHLLTKPHEPPTTSIQSAQLTTPSTASNSPPTCPSASYLINPAPSPSP